MASISTRKRGKTWEYSFEIASVNGKRKRMSKGGFKTKKECLDAGTKAKAEYDSGGLVGDSATQSLSDWLDVWYEDHTANLKSNTKLSYGRAIKIIKSKIGKYRLNSITPMLVQQTLNNICDEQYSYSYVRHVRTTLKLALGYAVTLNVLSYNPALNSTVKIKQPKKDLSLTIDKFDQILDSIPEDMYCFKIPMWISLHYNTIISYHIISYYIQMQVKLILAVISYN